MLDRRDDIDGLRAVAVLAVVAFHAFPALLPGGFVGVDVFFVISGFLITRIVRADLEAGRFSFARFYARRSRRIFPAVVVVLSACLMAGWFLLLADEYRDLGKHAGAAAAFVPNLLLWQEAGYFDKASELKPLLHFWSLGVEEQFYIAWPLLIWVSWRHRLALPALAVLVLAASFALGVTVTDPAAAFYSPLTRAWELMAGALLAGRAHPAPPRLAAYEAAGGLVLIVAALATIDGTRSFPGAWALLPTIGTALLIHAGPSPWVARALAARALVWIGWISFPLYLWHWPLLSLARILYGEQPPAPVSVALVAVSLVLAAGTYLLIEQPLRQVRRIRIPVLAACAAMLAIGGTGLAIFMQSGVVTRAAATRAVVNAGDIDHGEFFGLMRAKFFPCTPAHIQRNALQNGWPARCLQSHRDERKDVAVLGDSHAESLFLGLAERLPDANVVSYIQNAAPLLTSPDYRDIFAYLLADRDIRTVVVGAYWAIRIRQFPAGHSLTDELGDTIAALVAAGKRVYLLDDTPNFLVDASACKYRPRVGGGEPPCLEARQRFDAERAQYAPALHAIARRLPGVQVVTLQDAFCDDASCRMASAGRLLFRDRNHLSIHGSRLAAAHVLTHHPELRDTPRDPPRDAAMAGQPAPSP